MRKTTIEVDDSRLEEVSRALGTRGLKATVDRAFEEVLAMAARRETIKQLATMDGLDLDQPEVMAQAWE